MSNAKKLIKTNKNRNVRLNSTLKNDEQICTNFKFSQNKSKFVNFFFCCLIK